MGLAPIWLNRRAAVSSVVFAPVLRRGRLPVCRSHQPQRQLSAITALGTGPRPEVVPTLRKVLEHGRSEPDRQLAMQSLRKVALEQGDADGTIREAIRQVIYHASEDGMGGSARQVLEEIESAPAS